MEKETKQKTPLMLFQKRLCYQLCTLYRSKMINNYIDQSDVPDYLVHSLLADGSIFKSIWQQSELQPQN